MVMTAHKIEKDPSTEKYSKLEQKIYSFANKMGCENLIEYDNDSFWDELIDRIVVRDVIQKID
jgi:hypothetical protein